MVNLKYVSSILQFSEPENPCSVSTIQSVSTTASVQLTATHVTQQNSRKLKRNSTLHLNTTCQSKPTSQGYFFAKEEGLRRQMRFAASFEPTAAPPWRRQAHTHPSDQRLLLSYLGPCGPFSFSKQKKFALTIMAELVQTNPSIVR